MSLARRLAVLVVVMGALFPIPAGAKFGIVKTKVMLPRYRPPELRMAGRTVAVEVASESRRVSRRHESVVRGRLEEALRAWGAFELRQAGQDADNIVRIHLDDLEARVHSDIEYETRYVKVGTKEEWNEKKNRYETKDVYDNRREPVAVRVVSGHLDGQVELVRGADTQTARAGADYRDRFKGDASVPREAESEMALEDFLVEEAAARAVAAVCYTPDPVEALLAVDGDLKPGNRLAESREWSRALAEWSRQSFKGEKEAARLHNLGVAHEALAYGLPVDSPELREHLEVASTHYDRARQLDRDEKFFLPPLERIQVSLRYAEDAARYSHEIAASREAAGARPEPRPAADRPAPRQEAPLVPSPALSLPVLGSSGRGSWRIDGTIANVAERGRGTVVEIDAQGRPMGFSQALDAELPPAAAKTLSVAYRVLAGDARIRFEIGYQDEGDRARHTTLPVTAGEGPGPWSDWSTDLATVRPRPARITEVRLTVEEGRVRLSGLALAPE
jgi:hypothetical protein